MAGKYWFLPLVLAPLSACAFLLDFDELQGGGDDAGVGGAAGVSGSGGAAGVAEDGGGGVGALADAGDAADGGGRECETTANCVDNDPCTTDTCVDEGVTSYCKYEPAGQIVPDGFDTTIEVTRVHRLTLAVGHSRLYVSILTPQPDTLTLVAYPATGTATSPSAQLNVDDLLKQLALDEARSVAGLIADDSQSSVHAFFGARKGLGNSVYHAQLNPDLSGGTLAVAGNVYGVDPNGYPNPILTNSGVTAVWVGTKGTPGVFLGSASKPAGNTPTFASPAEYAAPLAGQSEVGAIWSSGSKMMVGIGPNIKEVPGCPPAASTHTSVSSAPLPTSGLSVAVWTEYASGSGLTSNLALTACDDKAGCQAFTECKSTVLPDTRNIAAALRHFTMPGDKVRLYTAIATPSVVPAAAFQWNVGLSLVVSFSQIGTSSVGLFPTVEIAPAKAVGLDSFLAVKGPDFPSIAMAGDRIYLGWIDRGGGASDADVIHLRRYKLQCSAAG